MYYYFDKDYLGQYIDLGKTVKVTVNNKVLKLGGESDLEEDGGVGYEENGDATFFDYMDIESITVGVNTIDLQTLQKIMGSEVEPEKKATKPPTEEEPPTEPPAEEEPEEEPAPPGVQKSSYDIYLIGRDLLHEARKIKRQW